MSDQADNKHEVVVMGGTHAVTENGTTLDKYTEDDVNLALRLLILHGGDVKQTVGQLAEHGIVVTHDAIRYWRDAGFPRRYFELRHQLGKDVGEELAGRAFERALEIDEVEKRYIEAAGARIDDVSPDKLAAAALSLAKAKGENIEKSQLLRNRPTEIKEVRDTAEILAFLERQGVFERDKRIEEEGEEDAAVDALFAQEVLPSGGQDEAGTSSAGDSQ